MVIPVLVGECPDAALVEAVQMYFMALRRERDETGRVFGSSKGPSLPSISISVSPQTLSELICPLCLAGQYRSASYSEDWLTALQAILPTPEATAWWAGLPRTSSADAEVVQGELKLSCQQFKLLFQSNVRNHIHRPRREPV